MILIVEPPGGGRSELPLARGLLTIGRGADCDLVLHDPQASRHHAELRRTGDEWLVVDIGSTNGTLVDGQRLLPKQPRPLHPGQTIMIGATRLSLRAGDATIPVALAPVAWPEAELPAEESRGRSSPALALLAWLSRILVLAAAVLLVLGSQRDWVRIRVQLPLLGTVLDRTFDGMDSGYGWLLLIAAVLAMVLVLVDVLSRRWGVAAGLGQALMAAFTAVALAVNAYTYYQAGSQSVFGISLLDVFTKYARNVVDVSVQPGIYLVAAGLGGMIIGGLLRLIVAGMEPAD